MECMKNIPRRNREHRCFKLCGRVMTKEKGSEEFKLVHGQFCHEGRTPIIAHAWIRLPDNRIYDATQNLYLLEEQAELIGYTPEVEYDKPSALNAYKKTKHWGPWHLSKGEFIDDIKMSDMGISVEDIKRVRTEEFYETQLLLSI